MTDRMLTVQDVARHTGLSPATVRAAIADGELPASRPRQRGRYLIEQSDLFDWLEAGRVRSPLERRAPNHQIVDVAEPRQLGGSVRDLVRQQRRDAA